MPSFLNLSLGQKAFACLSLLAVMAPSSPGQESPYARTTVVVYNTNFPNSDHVARHYATIRSIPSGNLIGLSCPQTEEISRAEYNETIAKPLRNLFVENNWAAIQAGPNGGRQIRNQIHVITLIYGMPLKVKASEPSDENLSPEDRLQQTDGCSVDSELALLWADVESPKGFVANPYYQKRQAFAELHLPQMMLVGRFDGPTPDRLQKTLSQIQDVERSGLWGRVYVDLADDDRPGYETGEDWLRASARLYREEGYAVVVDRQSERFPTDFPMTDAALYFGWYTTHRDGPFANPDFAFKPGAVACHVHSYSASSVRDTEQFWAGALVQRGAAAVLGNVYEPFLSATTNLDEFNKALLDGYTFIEAAYQATPYLSWMTVAIGDPLYRPFDGLKTFESQFYLRKDDDKHYKTFRVALKRWGDDPETLEMKLEGPTQNHKTGFYWEALGLHNQLAGDHDRAARFLTKAYDAYDAYDAYYDKASEFRVRLLLADLERSRGRVGNAITLLRELANDTSYRDAPGFGTVGAWLNQLDPPGPAGR